MTTIILKPVITEKSMSLATKGTYIFDVNKAANKPLLASAVKAQFKVDVTQVRVAVIKGKVKKFKGVVGQRKDIKRAYVTIKKGQKIAVFALPEEEKKK